MKYSSSGVADEIGTTVKITHMYASMHGGKYLQNYIKKRFCSGFFATAGLWNTKRMQ